MNYEELIQAIKQRSDSQLPGLLLEVAKEAYRRQDRVFNPGGASQFISILEERNGWGAPADGASEAEEDEDDGPYYPFPANAVIY